MSEKHRIAGQKGGAETLRRYGHEFYHALGRLGGRPRWEVSLARDLERQERARKRARGHTRWQQEGAG